MDRPIKKPLSRPILLLIEQLLADLQHDPNFTIYAFGIALAVLLLTWLIFRMLFGKRQRKLLLVGLSESGKTLCFTQLVAGRFVKTVTSMVPNESPFELGQRYPLAIDIPGYERVRDAFFYEKKKGSRAIMFLVDSVTFGSNLRDVADYLYTVLSDSEVLSHRLPVLVACNKQDAPLAKTPSVIRKQLEKEFNSIRETRAAALDLTNEGGSARIVLGNASREFSFNDLRNKVQFIGCSCKEPDQKPGLAEVRGWLTSNL